MMPWAVIGQVGQRPRTFTPAPPGNVVTWNPADKNAAFTLTGGNLIASAAISSWVSCRATHAATGKMYFEVSVFNGTTTGIMIGLGSATASLNSYAGGDANGWGFNQGDGQKYNNASPSGYNSSFGNVVIGVAYDPGTGSNGSVSFLKNNVSLGAAFTNLPPGLFPMISANDSGSSGETLTGRFKTGDLIYPPPSGYVPWGI